MFFQAGVPIFGGRPGLRLGVADAAMSRPSAASIFPVDGFIRSGSHSPCSPMRIFLARRSSAMVREYVLFSSSRALSNSLIRRNVSTAAEAHAPLRPAFRPFASHGRGQRVGGGQTQTSSRTANR